MHIYASNASNASNASKARNGSRKSNESSLAHLWVDFWVLTKDAKIGIEDDIQIQMSTDFPKRIKSEKL